MQEEFVCLKVFKESGQRRVKLVMHKEYGKCVYKEVDKESYERSMRECQWLEKQDSMYFPKNLGYCFDRTKSHIFEEFIQGNTLEECKNKYVGNEKMVMELFFHLVEGLSLLWKDNHAHRDLKPDNIIIKDNGIPVILDMGIAKFAQQATLTSVGFVPHTPIYAAPEQLNGEATPSPFKIDLFILGIVMLELFNGKHPFLNKDVKENNYSSYDILEIKENICNNEYNKPINCSESFSDLASKLLEKAQFKRFRSYKLLKEEMNNNWGIKL